jgi:hypothetical protein
VTFQDTFLARGRSREIPEAADAYGWLIGSWDLDVAYFVTEPVTRMKGEVHFAWVLDGRAVQDVWIMPRISDRASGAAIPINTFGTTLRIWDPSIQAWRVTWINPPSGRRDELIGRRSGNEIVQIGTHSDGTPIRWTFSEITPKSFRWTGDALQSDGTTWKLEAEFLARRKE